MSPINFVLLPMTAVVMELPNFTEVLAADDITVVTVVNSVTAAIRDDPVARAALSLMKNCDK